MKESNVHGEQQVTYICYWHIYNDYKGKYNKAKQIFIHLKYYRNINTFPSEHDISIYGLHFKRIINYSGRLDHWQLLG